MNTPHYHLLDRIPHKTFRPLDAKLEGMRDA